MQKIKHISASTVAQSLLSSGAESALTCLGLYCCCNNGYLFWIVLIPFCSVHLSNVVRVFVHALPELIDFRNCFWSDGQKLSRSKPQISWSLRNRLVLLHVLFSLFTFTGHLYYFLVVITLYLKYCGQSRMTAIMMSRCSYWVKQEVWEWC